MGELRQRIRGWVQAYAGKTLADQEAVGLADRLHDMVIGWLDSADYNADSLCVRCKHLRPALDPNLQKAYLGQCLKREWPFTLSITLQGWTECDVFEDSGKAYVPPDPTAVKAVAAAAGAKGAKRVEFYYSSTQRPGELFACDTARALELVKKLQARGVDAKAIDVAGVKDRFPIYHKAVSGPDASVRPVFGAKGALVDDFGTTVPALLVFEGDRYPSLAFPRSDARRGLIRVEQALEDLLAESSKAFEVGRRYA